MTQGVAFVLYRRWIESRLSSMKLGFRVVEIHEVGSASGIDTFHLTDSY